MGKGIFLQQLINGISLGGVYALEAVGFGIIFNVLKFSNFSHGGVVAICAYLGYFVSTRITQNIWLALALTTILGGFVGVIVEKLVFRPIRLQNKPLTYFFVNSITVAMLAQQFFSAMWGRFYFPYPEFMEKTTFEIGNLVVSRTYMMMLGISALFLAGLSLFLRRTRTGIAVRAASTDIYTPALMGVNTDVIISVTFAIAGVLAGVTGFFLGMTYSVTPFIGSLILKGIIASIIGGMGSLGGGIIAGILLGVVEGLLIAEVGASITPIVIYLAIVVLLLVRPQGIAGKLISVKA
jgi:branched-chain amino acid transport system permease protein